jgi:hypothetical protein
MFKGLGSEDENPGGFEVQLMIGMVEFVVPFMVTLSIAQYQPYSA